MGGGRWGVGGGEARGPSWRRRIKEEGLKPMCECDGVGCQCSKKILLGRKVFLLLWVIFALLDPDPDSEYRYDLIES